MRLPLAVLLVLGAAGCNRQAPGNDAGGGQGAGVAMRPGMWETQMRIVSVEAPNAPPEVVDALRANIPAAPPAERNCMTPAEAAAPAAAFRDRSTRENPGYDCTLGDSVFADGRIRMTLNCRSTSGQPELRQAMAGTYGADQFQGAITGETATPATDTMPSYPVRIASTLTGRRIGDCPAVAVH